MTQLLLKKQRPRGANFLIDLWCSHRTYAQSDRLLKKRGQRMAVYANDLIGIWINQFGYFENEELDFLFEFLTPLNAIFKKSVAFDIGANIGNHSVYFSKYFKSIQAFEPNTFTYDLLSFNLKWTKNVTPHNFGFGNTKGILTLVEDITNYGGSSIVMDNTKTSDSIEVQIERLDDFSFEGELSFIKIDVEGFESKVIQGAKAMLKKHYPVVVFEQHEDDFYNNTSPTIELLKKLGYKFCWHTQGTITRNWFIKRAYTLVEIFRGREHRMVSSDTIPRGFYAMVVAIPPRFQKTLGLNEL